MIKDLPETFEFELKLTGTPGDNEWWFSNNYRTIGFIEVEADVSALHIGGRYFIKCERYDDVYFLRNQLTVALAQTSEIENLITNNNPVSKLAIVGKEYRLI